VPAASPNDREGLPSPPRRHDAIAVGIALLVGLACLGAATVVRLEQTAEDRWRRLTRRYWEDTYLAIGHRLSGKFPVSYHAVQGFSGPSGRGFEEVRPTLTDAATTAAIPSWRFWQTVPIEMFRRPKPIPIFPRYDDAGRPLLLSFGFRLLGGVSPFLLFWIALLAAAPILTWMGWELSVAGATPAAATLLVLIGLCPFVADVLASPYSALGFYLVALFAMIALASYAALARRPTVNGLLARALAAGLVLAICSACRASCLALAPGFLLALAMGARRAAVAGGSTGRRLWLTALLGTAAVLVPAVGVSRGIEALIARTLAGRNQPIDAPPPVHPFWHGMWIGLGDFDRSKGYVWNDQAAFDAIVRAGGTPSTTTYYDPANERIARTLILRDVASDPAWMAGILIKRTAATLTQWKLRPWGPWSGRSIAPATTSNEGQIDGYYTLARPVDLFGIAGRNVELPIPVLLAPTLLLLAAALRARGRRHPDFPLERRLGVLACVAAATIGHPVLLTTASALETEAFALTYVVGAAFFVERMASRNSS
jgi:hypothetical protein